MKVQFCFQVYLVLFLTEICMSAGPEYAIMLVGKHGGSSVTLKGKGQVKFATYTQESIKVDNLSYVELSLLEPQASGNRVSASDSDGKIKRSGRGSMNRISQLNVHVHFGHIFGEDTDLQTMLANFPDIKSSDWILFKSYRNTTMSDLNNNITLQISLYIVPDRLGPNLQIISLSPSGDNPVVFYGFNMATNWSDPSNTVRIVGQDAENFLKLFNTTGCTWNVGNICSLHSSHEMGEIVKQIQFPNSDPPKVLLIDFTTRVKS